MERVFPPGDFSVSPCAGQRDGCRAEDGGVDHEQQERVVDEGSGAGWEDGGDGAR